MLSKEHKRKLFLKKAYYREHPEEAIDDTFRVRELKSDDFIMTKIYKWIEEREEKKNMKFPIGFAFHDEPKKVDIEPTVSETIAPVRSLVRIYFPDRNQTLTYYNDQFDLHKGDLVYVDGKLEGLRGRVVDVAYSFKIKASDYKKVIAVINTAVHGQFFMAGSHFVTFDANALPTTQVVRWFKAPESDEDEYIIAEGESNSFPLSDFNEMNIDSAVAERGHNYYMENRVRYICLDSNKGYAIVEGEHTYEVTFTYQDGIVSNLFCDCPCTFTCKHEFAAMLQLRETLELIEKHYADEYAQSGYFAAIVKGVFFTLAIDGKETGGFTL